MKSGKRAAGLVAAALSMPAMALAQRVDLPAVEKLIVDATNAFRHQEGIDRVRPDHDLGKAARDFAEYMAHTDRYGHTADGRNPGDRAGSKGYEHCLVAENIAYQYDSSGFRTAELARFFVEGWKHSPEHRRNMLEPAATDTAVAVARSEKSGRYYGVQMFGRPKSERIEFSIANRTADGAQYRIGNQDYSLRPREVRTHWLCVPEDLTLHSDSGAGTRVRPGRGERLAVVTEAGRVVMRRE